MNRVRWNLTGRIALGLISVFSLVGAGGVKKEEQLPEKYEFISGNVIDGDFIRADKILERQKKRLEGRLQSEKAIKSDSEFINLTASEIYQLRLKDFDHFLNIYSRNTPRELNRIEYKSLLIAIAQRESSLGHPNGGGKNDTFLMGYGDLNDTSNYGAKNQLIKAANTLKRAIEEQNRLYAEVNSKKGDEKIKGILSIYNRGTINEDGKKYADEVYQGYIRWKEHFLFENKKNALLGKIN
ncbi:hypothetical protein J4466_01835 [Candidatus Pacearchaeota archaeon]|nr:hypothetical protein [Candidatus Pacearchaeota archaeon]